MVNSNKVFAMESQFKVVFTGRLQSGFTENHVINNMVSASKLAPEKVEKLIKGGKRTALKKDVNKETAEKFAAMLGKTGMEIEIIEIVPVNSPEQPPTIEPEESKEKATASEKPPPLQPKETAAPVNPYAAPVADLNVEKAVVDDFTQESKKVSAGHGLKWVKDAFRIFTGKPWLWLGMTFVACVLSGLVNFIPLLGMFINTMFMTLLGGGLMVAAHKQISGETITLGHAFSGFSHNRNQLILLGLMYLLCLILMIAIMVIPFGMGFFHMMTGNQEAMATAMEENIFFAALMPLVMSMFMIPVMMGMWFSPSLIAINNMSALAAFKLSLKACLKNWLAFLIYGFVFLGLFFLAGIFFAITIGILTAFIGDSGLSSFFMVIPAVIIAVIFLPLIPVSILSIFASYRDIFYKSE